MLVSRVVFVKTPLIQAFLLKQLHLELFESEVVFKNKKNFIYNNPNPRI
jgi:hypothetical protein